MDDCIISLVSSELPKQNKTLISTFLELSELQIKVFEFLFNDTGHFVLSPKEREKRDKRSSRLEERGI